MKKSSLFILMAVMVLSLLMPKEALAAEFSDVSKNNDHYDGIHWLTEQGINGYEDGTFDPYRELTREHAAIFFTKVLDLKLSDEDYANKTFNDIDSDYEYAREIGVVAENGIFKGKNKNFNPKEKLSRQQMATTLVKAFQLKSKDTNTAMNLQGVGKSHKKNVQVLADLRITVALADFKPRNAITRGQFATFMHRSAEGAPEKSKPSIRIEKKKYNDNFKTMVNKQMKLPTGPKTSRSGRWVDASYQFTAYYLNTNNFEEGSDGFYQFLKLSGSSGVSAKELNQSILQKKGILGGKGSSFKKASNQYDVNDIYLISHALLESGNGTSQLATGIEVGLNKKGNPTRVTSSNRKKLKDIKTTYNMYGIGAVDSNALNGGSERAYQEGWFTPEEAIIGGASFIGKNYIDAGQDTLYKMRWNPDNPATHQYATDAGWAIKQTNRIKSMFEKYKDVDGLQMVFEVPVYNKQPKSSAMPKGNAKYKTVSRIQLNSIKETPKENLQEEVSPGIILKENTIKLSQ